MDRNVILIMILSILAIFTFAFCDDEWAVPIGPDVDRDLPNIDTQLIKSIREYYDEGSYKWALIACQKMSDKFPDSKYIPESELIRIRSKLKLDEYEGVLERLDDYVDEYEESDWGAKGIEIYIDLFTEMNTPYYSYSWQQYLYEYYEIDYYSYDYSELDEKRYKLLEKAEEIYNNLMDKATSEEEKYQYADRLIYDYIMMYSYLDWTDEEAEKPAQKSFAERTAYIEEILEKEMSVEMHSVVECFLVYQKMKFYTPDYSQYELYVDSGGEMTYDRWLAQKRYEKFTPALYAVSDNYPGTPGELLSLSSKYHYLITVEDDPPTALEYMQMVYDRLDNNWSKVSLLTTIEEIKKPALGIVNFSNSTINSPEIEVEIAAKLHDEVTLKLYSMDIYKYFEIVEGVGSTEKKENIKEDKWGRLELPDSLDPNDLAKYGDAIRPIKIYPYKATSVEDLEGVEGVVQEWTIETGCEDDYRIKTVEHQISELPPGLYILEVRAGDNTSTVLFLHTNAVLVSANDNATKFAFKLVNLETGENVQIDDVWVRHRWWDYDEDGYWQEYSEVIENPGVEELGDSLYFDFYEMENDQYYDIVAISEEGTAIYQMYSPYSTPEKTSSTSVVYTDRPLYKPEQTVNYKAILRHIDYEEKVLTPLEDHEAKVILYSPDGEEVETKEVKTNEYGSVSGQFELPEGGMLGQHYINVKWKVDERDFTGSAYFSVEEYEKPEYEVFAAPEKDRYLSGEEVRLVVTGKYYFGSPMSGSEVRYTIYRSGYTPDDEYDSYKKVHEGEGYMDTEGKCYIEFNTPYAGEVDNSFSIEIEVEDPSHHIVETSGYIYTYKNDQYVSIGLDKYTYHTDDAIKLTFNTYDWYQKPVPEKKVEYEIYSQKYNQQTYVYEKEETVYEGETTTGSDGTVEEVLELGLGEGDYVVQAEIEDSKDNDYSTTTTFNVVTKTEEVVERLPDFDIKYQYPDKGYFDLYDDVQITLISRYDEVDATIYFSANGLIEEKTIHLDPAERGSKATITISLDTKYLPYLYLHGHIVYDGNRYSDSASIYFNNTGMQMRAEVVSGEDEYQPGDTAKVDVEIEDPYGNPLDCEFSLSVVDESLLAIIGDSTSYLPSNFQNSLDRYNYVYLYDSLYNMGEIRRIIYLFPYYDRYPYTYASSFIPTPDSWGSVSDVLDRVYIPSFKIDPELQQKIDLSYYDRLGSYYTTLEKIEESGYTEEYLTRIIYGISEEEAEILETEEEVDGLGGVEGYEEVGAMGGGGGLGAGDMTYAEEKMKKTEEPTLRSMDKPMAMDDEISEDAYFDGGPITSETVTIAGKEFTRAELRKEFLDSAFWNSSLYTGDDGWAEIEFELPDNLTTWKLIGLAVDDGQRIGYMENLFEVKKNIIARMKAPRFLVVGDKAQLKLIAHNYLDVDKEFHLSIDTEGLKIIEGESEMMVDIEAGSLDTLSQIVTADVSGDSIIISSALTDVESDASQKILPVIPHGAKLKQAWAGRLREEVEHTLTVADKIDPQSFSAELILSPSLAATLSHGLDFFEEYPYECVEQTLNRFYPNTVMADAAEKLGLSQSKLSEGLDSAITEGLVRLEETQTDEGGWPWWKGGYANPYITALVVDALFNLRENAFVVEENKEKVEKMYEDAKSYLMGYIDELEEKPDRYSSELSLYIADVMLRCGLDEYHQEIIRESASYYYKYREHRSEYNLALLASVLHQLDESSKLEVVLRNLDNNAEVDTDRTIHWGKDPWDSWRWWDDAVEATSTVLEVKMEVEPDSPQIPYMVDWLVDQRRGAHWKSTKDSSVATTALMHYILNYPEVQEPIITGYILNDEKVGGIELDPKDYESPSESAVFNLEDFQTGDNTLMVERESGEGPVFYTMVCEYYTEADYIPAVEGSVQIDREYFIIKKKYEDGKLEEERLPLDRPLEIGEELEVVLTINSPYAFDFVVVEDPRPAGCINMEMVSYYDWWIGAYVQLFNEKRSIMFDRLPKGETVVSYRLRAEVPGEYSALPATIFGMYSPDIGSSTEEMKIEVSGE